MKLLQLNKIKEHLISHFGLAIIVFGIMSTTGCSEGGGNGDAGALFTKWGMTEAEIMKLPEAQNYREECIGPSGYISCSKISDYEVQGEAVHIKYSYDDKGKLKKLELHEGEHSRTRVVEKIDEQSLVKKLLAIYREKYGNPTVFDTHGFVTNYQWEDRKKKNQITLQDGTEHQFGFMTAKYLNLEEVKAQIKGTDL